MKKTSQNKPEAQEEKTEDINKEKANFVKQLS